MSSHRVAKLVFAVAFSLSRIPSEVAIRSRYPVPHPPNGIKFRGCIVG